MSHDQSSCSLDSPLAPPSWFAWSCLWTKLTRFCCAACSRNCWAASSSRVSENQLKCQFRYITHHKFISDSSMNMITDLTETNRNGCLPVSDNRLLIFFIITRWSCLLENRQKIHHCCLYFWKTASFTQILYSLVVELRRSSSSTHVSAQIYFSCPRFRVSFRAYE